jgi:hypothetical protein
MQTPKHLAGEADKWGWGLWLVVGWVGGEKVLGGSLPKVGGDTSISWVGCE